MVTRRRLLPLLFALTACRPDFGDRDSRITRPTILALQVEPPEAKPGEAITVTPLVATPTGTLAAETAWAFCATPRLLTENGAVSARCLSDGVRPVGAGPGSLTTAMPADACTVFGPETPSAEFRPRDADVTGGFFQPLRATLLGVPDAPVAFAFARVTCNLAGAPADAVATFKREYRPNANPHLLPLEARVEGRLVQGKVPLGARVVLRAAWPEADAERYALFDVATQSVVSRREGMRVSWFSTDGAFAEDRTGFEEGVDPLAVPATENVWVAPSARTSVTLWIVLRDTRGGVAMATHTLAME